MNQIGMALVGLLLGLAAGVALAALRRPPVASSATVIDARLETQAAELRRLADAAGVRDLTSEQLRQELSGARQALEQLRVRDEERRFLDEESRQVVRRLSTVLVGGASKGRAGEHVLREHLSQLPPSMLSTDFHVNGKTVEFALLLPDGRRLPVDSKWAAQAELEAFESADGSNDREACVRALEREVTARAKEVAQYLDPALTSPVAVAAVPDAVYACLKRAHADAFAKGVVIVPYSSALPIVLFLWSIVQRFGDAADMQTAIAEVASFLDAMEAVVENKFQRAATMITNGTDEFRSQLGKARGQIARARAREPEPAEGGGLTLVN